MLVCARSIVLALILISGCKADKPVPAPGSAASSEGTATPGPGQSGDRAVRILPENPTALVDLTVLVSGIENPTYQWEKNGQVLKGENEPRLAKERFSKGDSISVTASGTGQSSSASVTIMNTPPAVTAVTLSPEFIYRNVDITALPTGSDPDGDSIRYGYSWQVNGQDLSEHDQVLKGSLFKRGDTIVLKVTPYDNETEGQTFVSLPLVIPNAPPRFVSVPPMNFSSDSYTYQAHAEDADGDTMTYSLAAGPKGMTVNSSTGEITWQIGREDSGTHQIEIIAQDGPGLRSFQKYSLTITFPEEEKK